MLAENYFALFGLEQHFSVDTAQLRRAYRRLQALYHPDNFAGSDAATRLQSVQNSARVNDAYNTLADTVARARYLLELRTGQPVADNNLADEPAFLMAQIEAREQLEAIRNGQGGYDDLTALSDNYEQELHELGTRFEQLLEGDDLSQAESLIAKMQLYSKLLAETAALEDSVN